jgi:hypothetical protein
VGWAEWEARAIAFGRAEGAPGPERYALKLFKMLLMTELIVLLILFYKSAKWISKF